MGDTEPDAQLDVWGKFQKCKVFFIEKKEKMNLLGSEKVMWSSKHKAGSQEAFFLLFFI